MTTAAATPLQPGAVGAHARMPGFEAHKREADPARPVRFRSVALPGQQTIQVSGRRGTVAAWWSQPYLRAIAVMHALLTDAGLDKIAVFDRGRWSDFQFEVLPGQMIDTPSGRFDAVEVRYTSVKKNKSWSLHCAKALNYLPVMIVYGEDGKVKSRAELTDYRITD